MAKSLKYRKEIDGLRAIAVMPVLLFHAGFTGFSGGYVGVDVFFVISGFLITTIIISEIEKNNFSVINFYERRARRILPALCVVLIFTTVFSYLLLPAPQLKEYSRSLTYVAAFLSNVFFFETSGYFSTVADEKPLLHTWSLAVEEQYYLFFPLLMVLLWRLGKRQVSYIIILLILMSLAISEYLNSISADEANFYLIFSRAWELFAGSLIAFYSFHFDQFSKNTRELPAAAGLFLILWAIFFFDRNTPFPGIYTLIPVLGTCLVIIFANHQTITGRILSHKLPVFIGLISYSLYLWHQPVYALMRAKTIGEPAPYVFIIALFIIFIISYLNWKYVEKPFRNKTFISRKTIFKISVASILLFISTGYTGYKYDGFKGRFPETVYTNSIEYSPKRKSCHTRGANYLKPELACKYFGENITWAVLGDSHIIEPAYGLAKQLEKYNIGLLHLSFSGCPPILSYETTRPGCTSWLNESMEYLENNNKIKNVVLGFRYSNFLFGGHIDTYPELPDIDPLLKLKNVPHDLVDFDVRDTYWRDFQTILTRLIQSGKTLYVIYPVPEMPAHINKALSSFSVFSNKPLAELDKVIDSEYYFKRNEYIINKLDTLDYGINLIAIKPFEIFCNEKYCPMVLDGKALYFDDNHLSVAAANMLAQKILGEL